MREEKEVEKEEVKFDQFSYEHFFFGCFIETINFEESRTFSLSFNHQNIIDKFP